MIILLSYGFSCSLPYVSIELLLRTLIVLERFKIIMYINWFLFNNTLLCDCVNCYVDTNDDIKKSASSLIKLTCMSLDKYSKRKSLEDEESFKDSSHVTQSSSKKSSIEISSDTFLADPGLRRLIYEYNVNVRDVIQRAYLQMVLINLHIIIFFKNNLEIYQH